jgi:hypothetical protein
VRARAQELTSRYCAEGGGVLRQGHEDNLAEIEIGDYEPSPGVVWRRIED